MPKTGLAQECVSEAGKALCAGAGSTCTIQRDGYFVVSTALVILGSIIIATFIAPTARRLERASGRDATSGSLSQDFRRRRGGSLATLEDRTRPLDA